MLGEIIDLILGMGYKNDTAMFNHFEMKEKLKESGTYLLADQGYSHFILIQLDETKCCKWNNKQKSLCNVVKVVCGLATDMGSSKTYLLTKSKALKICTDGCLFFCCILYV